MEYRRIFESDRAGREAMEALLQKAGLSLDRHLDYSAALFDEDGAMVATGSFYRNTLRCLAVDEDLRGEGLLAQLVSRLISELNARGVHQLFLYTKPDAAESLRLLGFHEIARTAEVVFMENRRQGFPNYLDALDGPEPIPARVGAIVMNANPFTRGHLYLVEQALQKVDALHLFMVSEDVSAFPFVVRERLIRAGTAHLKQLYCHPTGPYLVSSATFPAYFIQESEALTLAQARVDAQVFRRIAGRLQITDRFVGEEPFSPATALYNQAMQEELPQAGIRLHILPRLELPGIGPISATRVRALLKEGRLEALKPLVPDTTYAFLESADGRAIREKLMRP